MNSPKFDYDVIFLSSREASIGSSEEKDWLKKKGADGWELVNVIPGFGGAQAYYLKRQIDDNEKESQDDEQL